MRGRSIRRWSRCRPIRQAMRRWWSGSRDGPAAGRRWSRWMETACGSMSPESRICSAVSAGWSRDVQRRFARIGLTARVAIAPTAAAAWALSHFGPHSPPRSGDPLVQRRRIMTRKHGIPLPRVTRLRRSLLPVAALRLDADTVRTLERLGLKTIGALIDVPRLALARRFRGARERRRCARPGARPQAGAADRRSRRPAAARAARLEEPATHPEAASQALERLMPDAGARARTSGGSALGGCRSPAIASTAASAIASVATAIPSREPKHLQRLLADKAAALDPEFGFDAFALTADWTEDLGAAQESLVEEPSGERELARLVDRLTVKLGRRGAAAASVRKPFAGTGERVGRGCKFLPSPAGDEEGWWRGCAKPLHHRLVSRSPPQRAGEKRPNACSTGPKRSTSSMPRPKACRGGSCGGGRCMTSRGSKGPERIAPEWWRQPSSRAAARLLPRRGCSRAAATGSTARV